MNHTDGEVDPVNHQCYNCGRTFKFPSQLKQHQRRKTPCAPIIKSAAEPNGAVEKEKARHACTYCGRAFSCAWSLGRHERGRCKIIPNEKNGEDAERQALQAMHRLEVAALKDEMKQLKNAFEQLQTSVAPIARQSAGATPTTNSFDVNGDHATVVNAPVTITFNAFGKESTAHITPGVIRKVLDESLQSSALQSAIRSAVLETARLVYSNRDHPENLTVFLPNKKTNDALVYGEHGWEILPASSVLPPMAKRSVDMLFDHQPHDNADQYGPLMKELRAREGDYTEGRDLKDLLVRNKDLVSRALGALPAPGAP